MTSSSPSPRKVSQVQQLTESEFEERFEHAWAEVDANWDGSIDEAEVGAGLGAATNVRLASYQVRELNTLICRKQKAKFCQQQSDQDRQPR